LLSPVNKAVSASERASSPDESTVDNYVDTQKGIEMHLGTQLFTEMGEFEQRLQSSCDFTLRKDGRIEHPRIEPRSEVT